MTTRYNPFEELERLFDRLSHQFAEASHSWDKSDSWNIPMITGPMRADLIDRNGDYVVTVDMPGFDRNEVSVSLTDQQLTISAESELDAPQEELEFIRREREHKSAKRTIALPEPVDEDAVSATMKNGVLTILLPKVSTATPRDVEITVG